MVLTKSAIFIEDKKQDDEKPIEFTHCLDDKDGWEKTTDTPSQYDKVIYLGNCERDGNMFCAYHGAYIFIFKGHLNSGKY